MSVQKFVVRKQSPSYTTIPNNVIDGLKQHLDLLGLYLYLLHMPPEWIFYKKELQNTLRIGQKKLERSLAQLAQIGLIKIAHLRNENGRFIHNDIEVLDGNEFKINNIEFAQNTVSQKPYRGNGGTDKHDYKRNINKTNINKENIKNSCATENIAQNRFKEFWNIYPRRKDKKRSESIWVKNKLDGKADEIIKDVKNRVLNDQQWKNEQYIPHPSTYLKFERWSDEVTLTTVQSNDKFNPMQHAINDLQKRMSTKKQEVSV